MKRITGYFDRNSVNIGDKHLTVSNPENMSSYRILIVDDVFEISPRENVYECTVLIFKPTKRITNQKN
jgi:hypothetical protein